MTELTDFEQKCQDWIDTPAAERDLDIGAKLMLQANRNRILHQNVLRKENFAKIEYELRKYLGDKYRHCDAPTVEKLIAEVNELAAELPTEDKAGKRTDHDQLPAEIQGLVFENSEKYARMRSIHERLKVLSVKGYTACDRFPHLKELLKLSIEIRENWNNYDSYVIGAITVEQKNTDEPVKIDAKRVTANRKFLSSNKSKLKDLIENKETEKVEELLLKMQDRYNELIMNGETFAPEQAQELKELGVFVAQEMQSEDNAE